MINRVVLVGRPTRELKLIKGDETGTFVCSFTLAVDKNFKNRNGEREADFIRCTAWKKTAQVMSQYVKKGSLIGVDGRIQTRYYYNKDAQRVYVTEVVVENFSFLGGSDRNGQISKNNQSSSNQNNDPFDSNGQQADISDDDLPF